MASAHMASAHMASALCAAYYAGAIPLVLPRCPHLLTCACRSFALQDKKLKLKLNANRTVIGVLRGFDPFM